MHSGPPSNTPLRPTNDFREPGLPLSMFHPFKRLPPDGQVVCVLRVGAAAAQPAPPPLVSFRCPCTHKNSPPKQQPRFFLTDHAGGRGDVRRRSAALQGACARVCRTTLVQLTTVMLLRVRVPPPRRLSTAHQRNAALQQTLHYTLPVDADLRLRGALQRVPRHRLEPPPGQRQAQLARHVPLVPRHRCVCVCV